MYMKRYFILLALLCTSGLLSAQVAINATGANPDASAGLDVSFTNKALLIPRVALTATNDAATIATPATTSLVYNLGTGGLSPAGYYYNAGTTVLPNWVRFMVGKEAWMITGNDNTTPSGASYGSAVTDNFIGTTNANDFVFATNNYEKMRIKTNADGLTVRIGMGTAFATAYPSGLTSTLLHIYDAESGATDFAQLQLGANKNTATNKVGEINFHATTAATDRRTASIESYITAMTGLNPSGDLRFFTNYSTTAVFSEKMRIIDEGRVGIGITAPVAYIDVHTPNAGGPFLAANFSNDRNLSGNNGLQVNTASTAAATRIYSAYANSVERISMRGNGRMIIGNTGTADDPNTMLDVVGGASGATTMLLTLRSDYLADNTGSGIRFINSTGATSDAGAEIVGLSITSANGRSDMQFNVHGGGGAYGALLERMRICGNGNVGIGTSSPDDKLDVVDNAQVSGYLRVGNPATPSNVVSSSFVSIWKFAYLTGTESWSVDNICGGTEWYVNISGANAGMLYFDNSGSYHRTHAYTPFMWIPLGSSSLNVEMVYYCTLENNFDGVWLEYRIGSGAWTKITTFDYNGYPDNASGCNTTCNGTNAQSCWNGSLAQNLFSRVTSTVFPAGAYGAWVQFRLVGVEDGADGTGEFDVKGFNVSVVASASVGGAFAAGNIYAEKNVYAGSNVLQGDVAEYFKVDDAVEAGDLVSLSGERANHYIKTKKIKDANVIGVVSTAPTITINQPDGVPIALTGRVPVKVTNENGEIKIGDCLTASSTPGYAMKAEGNCYIIGKAVEPFNNIKGKISCLIENGWINTNSNSNNSQSGGAYYIPKGTKSVIVRDASVSTTSRVFISMLADAGANYWLSKKENGMFEISLTGAVNDDIKFDYFVDNALTQDTPHDNSIIKSETYTEIKSVPARLATEEDLKVPPTPSDLSKYWKYENGKLIEYTPDLVKYDSENSIEKDIKADEKKSSPEKK